MGRAVGSIQMSNKPGGFKEASGNTTSTAELRTGAMAQAAIMPRLLNLEAAAAYLSVSTWTVRDMDAAGILPRVRVPLANGRDLRKLLFDKADLDRLIGAWKDAEG